MATRHQHLDLPSMLDSASYISRKLMIPHPTPHHTQGEVEDHSTAHIGAQALGQNVAPGTQSP